MRTRQSFVARLFSLRIGGRATIVACRPLADRDDHVAHAVRPFFAELEPIPMGHAARHRLVPVRRERFL